MNSVWTSTNNTVATKIMEIQDLTIPIKVKQKIGSFWLLFCKLETNRTRMSLFDASKLHNARDRKFPAENW